MPGRPARKRIHYLRAVFVQGSRHNTTFQTMVGNALQALPTMARTEVTIPSLGVLAIRNRSANPRHIKLAIGGGAPGESMSTLGLHVPLATDAEVIENPPANRAFKTSDAFCLISGDEVLLMVEGMRIQAVEVYFRQLLSSANQPSGHSAFELRPVGDQDQQALLEEEGVKELRLSGTAHQATAELVREEYGNASEGIITQLWNETVDRFKALLSENTGNEREQQVLAEHWGDLNITTTIKAAGGSRAEPIVLASMQHAGMDLVDERPENVQVTLITQRDSKISGTSLVLGKHVNLIRQNDRNDLSHIDVWQALEQYQGELINSGHWDG